LKKRIWFLAVTVLFSLSVMAFGILTSGAWFTNQHTSAGIILTSGSLDLHVTGGPLRAINLKPGDPESPMGVFCPRNDGTTELKYRGLFVTPDPLTHNLLKYTTLKVEQHTTGPWMILRVIPGVASVETESLRYYFKFPGQDPAVVNHPIVAGSLAPKEKICYKMWVTLDPGTPDSEQGKTVYFVLHLEATQVSNPAWP
jgi:hypothetical protein